MKKKVLGIALLVMSVFATDGFAQTATQAKADSQKCEQTCTRKDRCPYEGLTLTDAQKSQLKELDTKRAEARKQAKEAKKADKKALKAAGDSTRRAERLQYLRDVKAIVGPEQYVIFLENIAVNGGGRMQMKAGDFRRGKDAGQRKGGKARMHKGARPDADFNKQGKK